MAAWCPTPTSVLQSSVSLHSSSPLDELPSKECIYGMVFRSSIILVGFTIQSVTILAQHVFVGGISAASSGHDPLSLLSTVLLSLCVVLNRSLYI